MFNPDFCCFVTPHNHIGPMQVDLFQEWHDRNRVKCPYLKPVDTDKIERAAFMLRTVNEDASKHKGQCLLHWAQAALPQECKSVSDNQHDLIIGSLSGFSAFQAILTEAVALSHDWEAALFAKVRTDNFLGNSFFAANGFTPVWLRQQEGDDYMSTLYKRPYALPSNCG